MSIGSLLICQSGSWKDASGSGVGVGQTWQNMLGSAVGCAGVRASNVVCTNSTGKPIVVSVMSSGPIYGRAYITVNGVVASWGDDNSNGAGGSGSATAIIPAGNTYSAYGVGLFNLWAELR